MINSTEKIAMFFVYFWIIMLFVISCIICYLRRNIIKSYLKNLKHIFRHKWFVFLECCEYRLYWQGLVHDLSKFSLIEFRCYADNFFGEKKRFDFKYAWLHHQHNNKHHWNYWVVNQNKKTAIRMPYKYVLEMVCDWKAISRQFDNDVSVWYIENMNKMILYPETRGEIEEILNLKENH